VESPQKSLKSRPQLDIKVTVGEEARYSAEFTPKEMGLYTIYAYLYDGWRRTERKTKRISAQKKIAITKQT